MYSAGGPADKIQACVCVLGCVSSYGNVWKAISINGIVWQRKQASVAKLKRWAVPGKMRSCGAIEMHESEPLLGQ